jgi:uncharacterized protein (DUF1501 family)
MMNRRDFLKNALAGLTLVAAAPSLSWASASPRLPVLVAVHLTGGNDALNTLVPFRDPVYRASRPQLGLATKSLLTLTSDLAFHPSLPNLARRFEQGEVLVMPGIGRPDHDRSHFRSSDLWHCAGHPEGHGWMALLGAEIECRPVSLGDTVSRAVACPGHPPLGILGRSLPGFPGSPQLKTAWTKMMTQWSAPGQASRQLKESARLVEEMAGRLAHRMDAVKLQRPFEGNDFGHRFETATRMIAAGFPSRLYHIGVGQFDTHSDQLGGHARELSGLDSALEAMLANLSSLSCPVVVMVYSEFGRRVQENFSGGTDHGGGGLAWLVGASVKGGVEGPGYGLDSLQDGDLRATLDYRQLYSAAVAASFGGRAASRLFADRKY